MLNKEGGLKGICGDNDCREIQRRAENGDDRARLALDMLAYRYKKYIGAYYAVLGRVDALIFTGGIGENSSWVRAASCDGLAALGICIDPGKNESCPSDGGEIQANDGAVRVMVIPTNEEFEIAEQTVQRIGATGRPS
jgi:acetate kinase